MSAQSTESMRDERLARAQMQEARFFVDMLQFSRLVLLFGEPGAGKTTLLRDGVIPALRAETTPGETRHVIYFDTWNNEPLVALDACIEGTLPPALFASADTPGLRYGPWVDRLGAWTREPGQRLIFIFDHFERYLAVAGSDPRPDAFARQWIAALAAPTLPVQFLVAMRASAESALMQRFSARIAGLGDNRVVLPPRHRVAPAPERAGASGAVAASAAAAAPIGRAVDASGVGAMANAPGATAQTPAAAEPIAVLGIEQLEVGARATTGQDATARAPIARDAAPRAATWPDPGASGSVAHERRTATPVPPRPAALSERKPGAGVPPSESRPPRSQFPGTQTGARTEPWFDPVGAAPAAHAPKLKRPAPPPRPEAMPRKNDAARAAEVDVFEDDLFGPEPDTPPPSRVEAYRARRKAVRGAMLLLGIVAAVVVSAALFVPPNDQRIPLRARAAAAGAQGAASLPAAPGAVTPSPPPAPSPQADSTGQALPPLERAPPVTAPRETPTVNAKGGPPPPVARPASPVALGLPAEPARSATPITLEADAATVMARDVGGALAAEGHGAPAVRAGIGATAAAGPRGRSDLFIARYDVLDAMRSADSGDSRNIDGLRLLVPLQVEPIYFAVRRDDAMAYVHEIANRRINLGAGGTDAALGSAHLYDRLFDTPIGAQRASYMPDTEALTALVDERSVDVVILVGRAGFTALAAQQRATPGAFKLLTFDPASVAGRRALRSYLSVELSPSPGSSWVPQRLPALAVMSFLVGRGIDEERTGRIVRTLCQERGRLRSTGHPYWLSVGFNPVNAPGWRYAAGAERELRACSARWSAGPDAPGAGESRRSVASRLNIVSAAER